MQIVMAITVSMLMLRPSITVAMDVVLNGGGIVKRVTKNPRIAKYATEAREEAEIVVIAKCRSKYRDLLATGPYTTQDTSDQILTQPRKSLQTTCYAMYP